LTDKFCRGCLYEEFGDSEECDGCSRLDDLSCSCHLNPPCDVCVNDYYIEKED